MAVNLEEREEGMWESQLKRVKELAEKGRLGSFYIQNEPISRESGDRYYHVYVVDGAQSGWIIKIGEKVDEAIIERYTSLPASSMQVMQRWFIHPGGTVRQEGAVDPKGSPMIWSPKHSPLTVTNHDVLRADEPEAEGEFLRSGHRVIDLIEEDISTPQAT